MLPVSQAQGAPPLSWQGLGATFREDHKTCFCKKKKKNLGTHTKKAQFRSQQGPWVLFCYFCIKARPHPYTQGTSAGFEVHCILDAGQTGTQEGFSGPRNWSSCCASLPLMGQASRFLPFIPRAQHASSPKLLLT